MLRTLGLRIMGSRGLVPLQGRSEEGAEPPSFFLFWGMLLNHPRGACRPWYGRTDNRGVVYHPDGHGTGVCVLPEDV